MGDKLTQIALHAPVEDVQEVRTQLIKRVPETIPSLIAEFDKTATSGQDQMLIMSLDIELKKAGLQWLDLSNLLRFQIVAHKRATMAGVVNATKVHPNRARLSDWEANFLNDIGRRKKLLTDKQMACLQSIADSLNMSQEAWSALADSSTNGTDRSRHVGHANHHIGELY